jgi:hypothetical protein
MANFPFGSRQILRVRVALLDSTGAPDSGASNGYVTGNPVSIAITPSIEAGDEFILKNGAGTICQQARTCDKVKGVDATVNLCDLDPKLIALMTGGTVLDTADGSLGFMVSGVSDDCPVPVSLEWWTIAQNGSSQATLSSSALYQHWVIPYSTFVIANTTFENGITTFSFTGKGQENANITLNGPFDDWPAGFSEDAPDGLVGPISMFYETSLPAAANDYVSVTSAAS